MRVNQKIAPVPRVPATLFAIKDQTYSLASDCLYACITHACPSSFTFFSFDDVVHGAPPLQIFVFDMAKHEAWKRGAAVMRQDKGPANEAAGHAVVEPSEELRLKLLKLVSGLVETLLGRGTTPLLHPYFHDLILFLQAHLRDPAPEVKAEACRILAVLCRCDSLNQGMIVYALALARAGLPVLRHRHARVHPLVHSPALLARVARLGQEC